MQTRFGKKSRFSKQENEKKIPKFEDKLSNYVKDLFNKNYEKARLCKRIDNIDDSNIKV